MNLDVLTAKETKKTSLSTRSPPVTSSKIMADSKSIPSTSTNPHHQLLQKRATRHLAVFVHGWKGNGKELDFILKTMQGQSDDCDMVFYNAESNAGKTNDGIENGGRRLALEVEEQIRRLDGPVLLSFVANSLGGLYARSAIAHMDMTQVIPVFFCTIATPHLGIHNHHNYLNLSDWSEKALGRIFGATGRDLFCQTSVIREMGTSDRYLDPLRLFHKRIALANAYRTDFLVPTTTAAFLSRSSNYTHNTLDRTEKHESFVLSLETVSSQSFDRQDISQCLDAMVWTKMFLDVRDAIPGPSIRIPFARAETVLNKAVWTSQELIGAFDRIGSRWALPLGHQVSSANSKNKICSLLSSKGRPIVEQLAQDLLVCSQQSVA